MMGDTESGRAVRILAIVGGIALMIAMGVEVVSVIGRHTAMPLIGSIELVQAAVVISASVGMVIATIERSHAIVHVVVDWLPPSRKRVALVISRLAASLFFAAIAAGAAWSFAEHWGGHEESELLAIPYPPLRLALIASCTVVAAVFAWQSWRGDSK